MESPIENKIKIIIEPSVEKMGYEVVQIKLMPVNNRQTLQVMIERKDEKNISIEDCEKVSFQVSALLDVEDPVSGEYNLEISSPGIDRPLTRLKDFEKCMGLQAKIKTHLPVQGKKNIKGYITETNGHTVKIKENTTEENSAFLIEFNNIKQAKLVINEELLAKKH